MQDERIIERPSKFLELFGSIQTSSPSVAVDAIQSENLQNEQKATESNDLLPFHGLKIRDRKVQDAELSNLSLDHRRIGMQWISKITPTKNWFTYGIVYRASPSKTSSNGKKYVTWAISDLKNGIVKLLLFGEAHNAHWKHGERSAICILNAKILPSRPKIVFSNDGISTENHNSSNQSKEVTDSSNMSEYLTYDEDIPCLTVERPDQILIVGYCDDLDYCCGKIMKGVRKGQRCQAPVNKNVGKYCSNHLNQKVRKIASERMDMNNGGVHPRFKDKALNELAHRSVMGSARMNLKAAPPKESQEQAKIIQKKLRPNQSVSNTSRYISGLPTYVSSASSNLYHAPKTAPPPLISKAGNLPNSASERFLANRLKQQQNPN